MKVAAILAVCGAWAAVASAVSYDAVVSPEAACRDAFWAGVDALGDAKLKDAEKSFEKAVKADEKCFLAYVLLYEVAYARGDREKAARWLAAAPPEPPEVDAAYEEIRDALVADDWPAVARTAAALVEAYPQTMTVVAALHLLGRAQYYNGDKEQALFTLKAAYMYSDLAPGTVPAYGSKAESIELETFAGRR